MYINIDGMKINYDIIGNQGISVIFLHGYMVDMKCMKSAYENLFSKINKEFKRVYLDLPGMGKSDILEKVNSTDKILDIIIKFVDKINIEKFIVVGYSYGGYLAQGLLKKMSSRILGINLLCPVVVANRKYRNLPDKMNSIVENDYLTIQSNENDYGFSSMDVRLNKGNYNQYLKDINNCFTDENYRLLVNLQKENYEFSFNIDLDSNIPALFIVGKQDIVVGYKDIFPLLKRYKNSSLHVIANGGHSLYIDNYDLFQSINIDWFLSFN